MNIHKLVVSRDADLRRGQPPKIGSAAALLASDAASYICGSTMLSDAGWTAIDGPPTGLTQVG